MLKYISVVVLFALSVMPALVEAGEHNNQVFFRGGYSFLTDGRGTQVFTDTNGTTTQNDGTGGLSLAAGLKLNMHELGWFGGSRLLGEVFIEYSRFSRNTVTQATSALLAAPTTSNVTVSQLNVAIAPQLRFEALGRFKPFISPVGLAFLVSSPPSDDTTYLDIGLQVAAGFEVEVTKVLSLGADVRYTHGFEQHNTSSRTVSTGAYVGVNF